MKKQGKFADEMGFILFAGGQSSRMGSNKAMLSKGEETFWESIADTLNSFGPVYLSVSKNEDLTPYNGCIIIRDEGDRIGPLGGLISVIHHSVHTEYFLCACDMPFMNREYIRTMLKKWSEAKKKGYQAIAVRDASGRINPAGGIVSRDMLIDAEQLFEAGIFKIGKLFDNPKSLIISEEELSEQARHALININTLKEYDEYFGPDAVKSIQDEDRLKCRVKLIIGRNEEVIGPGVVSLLLKIGETGSINAASKQMNISYSKAWNMIRRIEAETGHKFLESKTGGKKGGNSELTQEAVDIIEKYRKLRKEVIDYAEASFKEVFADYL